MSHNRYMSWSDVLTMAPTYPPSGAAPAEYPSPVSRRQSECFSDMSNSRRGSLAGFGSDMENTGHWQSIGSNSTDSKSPLASFGFFKGLTEKKTTREDGQPPKRRGPKPDSKPALTRRQELNRQAQRTHRERKEMYIKALEQEVLRLKEVFGDTAKERDAFRAENQRLKELLAAHGIAFDSSNFANGNNGMSNMGTSSYGGSSRGSISAGYGPGSSSTGYTSPPLMPNQPLPPLPASGPPHQQHGGQPHGLDYDQLGIDFVLTLERPCMDHMQFLMIRANDSEVDVSGHALMATCPPESHVAAHPEDQYPHQMPDVTMPDLLKLLDLSNRLPLDGEITPIMAWAMVLQDPRFSELTKKDVEGLKAELLAKIRCYGFGAVLEEFEVRDSLMACLAAKSNTFVPNQV
ncbi:hypothetical protein P154DRAFT_436891 [Amniculicola lignicola CBS 123094]|uniref:BZIP domain-containing protein n=1 Tax=Amniculicola lignicola CBS 123094 TaxID=1392246 RepID=A0A6A5WPH6_9PLEO|nr:hypothetical protein P154DRAFT_436891 [Amniculicola lignicola CBS 123094]